MLHHDKMAIRDLQVRVAKLEARTVSGVPELSIASRFDALHERIDVTSKNIRDHVTEQVSRIDARIDGLEASMTKRFEQVDQRFELVDQRFDKLENHLVEVKASLRTLDEVKSMLQTLVAR